MTTAPESCSRTASYNLSLYRKETLTPNPPSVAFGSPPSDSTVCPYDMLRRLPSAWQNYCLFLTQGQAPVCNPWVVGAPRGMEESFRGPPSTCPLHLRILGRGRFLLKGETAAIFPIRISDRFLLIEEMPARGNILLSSCLLGLFLVKA
ncbi:UNVERIFIED_CONTAM: hypothetical protein K2H54_016993 [Gekko kuhli]